MSRRIRFGTVLALSAVVLAALVAAPSHRVHPSVQQPSLKDTPGSASLRAYRDPESGEMRVGTGHPGALTLDPETREALRHDGDGLVEEYHPDGSVTVNLQGRFQSATVAHIGKDGKVTICTDASSDATDVLRGRVAPPPRPAAEVK